jgi:hypothetical protein
MKIYVCCEGEKDREPLTSFIEKYAGSQPVEVICETHASIKNRPIRSRKFNQFLPESEKNYTRLGMMAKLAILAFQEESEHICYHQDAGHQGFEMVYDGIRKDFDKAIPEELSSMKRLAIVPKEMTESWLLGDRAAFLGLDSEEKFPSKPEELWGDVHNRKSNYPKYVFERLVDKCTMETDSPYSEIAHNTDIDVIKKKCPLSFGQFCNDMAHFINRTIKEDGLDAK